MRPRRGSRQAFFGCPALFSRGFHAALAQVAAGLALCLISPPLLANGRFPSASQLVVDPEDASHIAVVATYGLLESFDAGTTWSVICEAAYGARNGEDPALGIASGGTMILGTRRGLSRAEDPRGCAWGFVGGPLQGEDVTDVAVERNAPSHAVAVTSTVSAVDASFAIHVLLAESLDAGQSWQQAGTPLPDDFLALTVDVAPSDPRRVYVSGASLGSDPIGLIERSDDRGAHWQRWPVTPAVAGSNIYISAIDPQNPDLIYARVSAVDDVLLVSSNGGQSWKPIHQATRAMLGFALSPDGTKVAVGGLNDDLRIAPTSTYVFESVSSLRVRCLAWTEAGLYACADEQAAGFTIGLSVDEAKSFRPLYHVDQQCSLDCPSTSPTASLCGTGCFVGDDGGAPYEASAADAEREAESTETLPPDEAHDAAIDDVVGAGEGDGAGGVVGPAPAEDSGCGCVIGARSRGETTLFLALGLLRFGRLCRSRPRRRAC